MRYANDNFLSGSWSRSNVYIIMVMHACTCIVHAAMHVSFASFMQWGRKGLLFFFFGEGGGGGGGA